jgi:hypothetical protein
MGKADVATTSVAPEQSTPPEVSAGEQELNSQVSVVLEYE